MVAPQEIRCVGQLPVTLTKYRRKSTEKKIDSFGSCFYGAVVWLWCDGQGLWCGRASW